MLHLNLGVKQCKFQNDQVWTQTSRITLVIRIMLPSSKSFLNLDWLSSHLWGHANQILRPLLGPYCKTMVPTFGPFHIPSVWFIFSCLLYLVSCYLPLKTQSGCHDLCKMSLHFIVIKRTSFYILVALYNALFQSPGCCDYLSSDHVLFILASRTWILSGTYQVLTNGFWINDPMRWGMEWTKITNLESHIYTACIWDLVGGVVENTLQKLIVKVNQFV